MVCNKQVCNSEWTLQAKVGGAGFICIHFNRRMPHMPVVQVGMPVVLASMLIVMPVVIPVVLIMC